MTMDAKEKLIKQAISHFRYGVSHNIFSEPVTTYAKLAIEALEKENEMTVMGMAKYIDREALVEWLKRIPLIDLSDGRGLCRVIFEDDFKKAIKKMPKSIIADVSPVRHGKWECQKPCPVCGEDRFKGLDADIWSDWVPPYCPNCGAKMEEG